MTLVKGASVEQTQHENTGKKWDLDRRQARFAVLMLIPALLMIILFIGYPIVYSFLLTFSKFTVSNVEWFASGFSNYERVVTDRSFATAFKFTLAYTVVYVPISIALGLLVGVLLQQIKIGTTFFRSMLFLPTVIPVTMGLLMFQWVLDPNNGIVNHLLANVFGLPELAGNWFSNRELVFQTLVGVTLWGFGPWILLLAGLLAIPKDFYEAARVDGATHWQEFRFITLPQLRNTLSVVTTLQLIKALKLFVPIYILTNGNPAGSTQSLYYLVFLKINQGQNWYTYASTVGWVFTSIIIVITVVTAVLFRSRQQG